MPNIDRLINYNQGAQIIEKLENIRDVLDNEDVSFATCTDSTFYNLLRASDRGEIDLAQDYGWTVGDRRKITLKEFTYKNAALLKEFYGSNYYWGENTVTVPAMDVWLTILDTDKYNLSEETAYGQTKSKLIIGISGFYKMSNGSVTNKLPIGNNFYRTYDSNTQWAGAYDSTKLRDRVYWYKETQNKSYYPNQSYYWGPSLFTEDEDLTKLGALASLVRYGLPDYITPFLKSFVSTYWNDYTKETKERNTKIDIPSITEFLGGEDNEGSKSQFEYYKVAANRKADSSTNPSTISYILSRSYWKYYNYTYSSSPSYYYYYNLFKCVDPTTGSIIPLDSTNAQIQSIFGNAANCIVFPFFCI